MQGFRNVLVAAGFVLACAGGFVVGLSGASANAATLESGTLFFNIGGGALGSSLSGAGPGSSAGGPGSIVTLGVTPFAAFGPATLTLSPTAASPLTSLKIQLSAPTGCSFTGAGGPGGGLGGPCGLAGFAAPRAGGGTLFNVPLSGIGAGPAKIGFGFYGSYFNATAWTTGTATATVLGTPVLITAGYDNRTVGGGGTVKLVAPSGLMSTLGGNQPIYTRMTLTFTPEPTSLLLAASALAAVALLGRKRRQS